MFTFFREDFWSVQIGHPSIKHYLVFGNGWCRSGFWRESYLQGWTRHIVRFGIGNFGVEFGQY